MVPPNVDYAAKLGSAGIDSPTAVVESTAGLPLVVDAEIVTVAWLTEVPPITNDEPFLSRTHPVILSRAAESLHAAVGRATMWDVKRLFS